MTENNKYTVDVQEDTENLTKGVVVKFKPPENSSGDIEITNSEYLEELVTRLESVEAGTVEAEILKQAILDLDFFATKDSVTLLNTSITKLNGIFTLGISVSCTANTLITSPVVFGKTLSAAPRIFLTPLNSNIAEFNYASQTTTGFNLQVKSSTTQTVWFSVLIVPRWDLD